MLDPKFIIKNIERVRDCIKNKNEHVDLENFLSLYEAKKSLMFEFEEKRKLQNSVSKKIAQLKQKKLSADKELQAMKTVASEVKLLNEKVSCVQKKLDAALLAIPNIFDESVPIGKDDSANKVIRYWGEKPTYDFVPRDHVELCESLGLVDFKRGTKITGSGFHCYTGLGARLERALINFMLDYHREHHGYTEIMPPYIVNRQTMTGTGQLPKLENDMYHTDEEDFFLIPTAEVPVTNMHSNEILQQEMLPIKYVAYTPCFRREAGSYGKDTRGLQRVHQFNKVELVQFVEPEKSEAALKNILADAESILQALGLHYRVVQLASGDLSFAAYKCYDLEVWAPGIGKYLEVSSCSSFIDFQSRRANIRYRSSTDGALHFVHTLNGSGLATPRTIISLLETYQESDGRIKLPFVIRGYMGNLGYLSMA